MTVSVDSGRSFFSVHFDISSAKCEHSSLQRVPWVRGDGPWGDPMRDDSKSRGDVRGGSLPPLEGEGILGDRWAERPFTLILQGHETLEERAKFTIYKILVNGSQGNSWMIFRRYTDFCRLQNKLKDLFPSIHLVLPPKRWFKDNYDEEFLAERQTALQKFLHNLTKHKDMISSDAVRQFLCMSDPPGPFDSVEESRAFCETLEETNHRLQRELMEKQRDVDNLTQLLNERENYINRLMSKVRCVSLLAKAL
ncbi:sorting nexin-16-like [Dunckerocampus dactyliophorus]|uniref:sorting nexin-16-like n=1 Tax=Dunckerocampus dactyliophorus TaxID=161453 RepID=UPI002406944E|nr:sorting nexin-16-like [Dunckerocampus dactyliophorus]